MRHDRISLAEPERWREALEGVPHAFGHSWGSCRAMQLTSGLETFLYRYEDAGGRVVCPFSVRSWGGEADLLTPYGFSGFVGVGHCPEFPARWSEFAREEGFVCGYVGLHPVLDDGSRYHAADRFVHNVAHVLDLTLEEDELFARLSVNRRRQIREWERGRARLVLDRPRLAEFFAAQLERFLEERGAAGVYYLSPASQATLFGLDDVLLLGAERDGELEAVSVFAATPWVGEFLFNVSLPGGREHSAALIWAAALRLRESGVAALNLGGGVRPGDGIDRFKERFGGRAIPLASLKQVYAAESFAALCARAMADPADRTAYFPPYHAR